MKTIEFKEDLENKNVPFPTKRRKASIVTEIDLSLKNEALYDGCEVEEVAGRLNLVTKVDEAVNIVGRNVAQMDLRGDEIILTGAMAVWAYLVVFHAVVHTFSKVWYDDGRNERVLIAAHG